MESGQILSAVDAAKTTYRAAESNKAQKAKARIDLYLALCQKTVGNMGVMITFNGKSISLFPDPHFIIFYHDETRRKDDRGIRYQVPSLELRSNGDLSEFFDALLEASAGVSVSVWNAQP